MYRVQYVRHLHEKVHVLEQRTAPPKDENAIASQEATAAALGFGGALGLMGNEPLMITNGGGGYGGKFSLSLSVSL